MSELEHVGPTVQTSSSLEGSQQTEVISGLLQRPKRTKRRFRMVSAGGYHEAEVSAVGQGAVKSGGRGSP